MQFADIPGSDFPRVKERQIVSTEEKLKLLLGVSTEISRSLDMDKTLSSIAESAAKITGEPKVAIRLIDGDKVKIISGTQEGGFSEEQITAMRDHAKESGLESPSFKELASGKSFVYVADATTDNRVRDKKLAERLGFKSYVAVPLRESGQIQFAEMQASDFPEVIEDKVAGKIVGDLRVYSSAQYAFSPEDIELLGNLAVQASIALNNARLHQRVQELATTDGLTNLPNRRTFEERLDAELARARRSGHPLSLVMFDIDHFKHYNDTNGHRAGDALLTQLGGIVRRNVRVTDTPARYGGEEFAVILPETDKEGAWKVAEKIRKAVFGTDFPHGENSRYWRV